jgi:hypothetical protein
MTLRSSRGNIEPEIRLALTPRLLAGYSYPDTTMLFAIAPSSLLNQPRIVSFDTKKPLDANYRFLTVPLGID